MKANVGLGAEWRETVRKGSAERWDKQMDIAVMVMMMSMTTMIMTTVVAKMIVVWRW